MHEEFVDRNQFIADMVENVPGGIFQFCISDDGTMGFRYRSRRAYELAHLPPDWSLEINAHPDDRERLIESVRQAIRAVSSWSFEGRCLLISGDIRWIHGLAVPTRGDDEVLFNGLLLDITDRKCAEELLRQSERRFGDAFEYAAIGMGIVSPEGRFLKVNRSFCKLLGYSESELLSRTFQDVTHEDDLKTDLALIGRMLTGEISTYQREKRYIRKSGEPLWAMLSASRT